MMISFVIIAKNAEDLIKGCIRSIIDLAGEIIVIDNLSEDETAKVAKKFKKVKVYKKEGDFSQLRNFGKEKAKGDWIFYIDTDERLTSELKKEILEKIKNTKYSAFAIPRQNYLLGFKVRYGGWWPDYVVRLIKKQDLVRWEGKLHEQPRIRGEVAKMESCLLHYTHRTLEEMVEKTNKWSEIEARLLFEASHPPVTWWRFLSIGLRELYFRGIKNMGFLDGLPGIIEIIYQTYSRMITYAKLWEMQIKKKR